tara:strand:- start:137 stop:445 length:309 start_codon:yes stop_codon:yes gene_type:complete
MSLYHHYYDSKFEGNVIRTKRKTPKQREKYKKLKLKQEKLSNKMDIAKKNLEKFKKENEKIISKWNELNNIYNGKAISWGNAFDETNEYEEQFKVRDIEYVA